MVWFQCDDCGEDLKKPKLRNHFRMCSATKLTCLDCRETFGHESVQGHTQCITEAEKYGPKGQTKSPHNAQSKANKPKPNADVDVNVGLSSRPPWFCSLCNTTTTSQQTLLLHAEGKKHRAKARAYHAKQNQPNPAPESAQNAGNDDEARDQEAKDSETVKSSEVENGLKEVSAVVAEQTIDDATKSSKKRKSEASTVVAVKNGDFGNGEVIQADEQVSQNSKKKKGSSENVSTSDASPDHSVYIEVSGKIKWKQLVTSILNTTPDKCMKVKKLKKVFLKAVSNTVVAKRETEDQLLEKLMKKVSNTRRFLVEGKVVRIDPGTTAAKE